jgi:hypothetical protein
MGVVLVLKFALVVGRAQPQTLDIVDLAIHGVVCQKSDFRGNGDIQNSQKLDPLEITAKKFQAKIS